MLTSEKETRDKYAKATFFAFWLFSATTSFLFGTTYLTSIWKGIVELLPLSAGIIGFVSSALGGVSAIVLTDIAYRRWRNIRRNCSSSMEQLWWARVAEDASFYISQTYSVTIISTTVFGYLFSDAMIQGIEWYGFISIILITLIHMIAYKHWEEADPDVAIQRSIVQTDAMIRSEELDHKMNIARAGVTGARDMMNRNAGELARQFSYLWSEQIQRPLRQQIEQNLIGRGGYAEPQSPQQEQPQSPQQPIAFTPDEAVSTPVDTDTVSGDTGRFRRNDV